METIVRKLELIVERVFEHKFAEAQGPSRPGSESDAPALRTKLISIHSKEPISIAEAAVLLNCSDGHLRNLIRKARDAQAKRPIPIVDLDGVTVFNRIALLEWASRPQREPKAVD